MNREILAKLYSFNMEVIEENLDGVTHEESLVLPCEAGNCINWVLGHIVASRNQIMELVGEAQLWSEEEKAPYRRGSAPLADSRSALPITKLLMDLRVTQEKLQKHLLEMSLEELETPLKNGTRLEHLALFQFHEAYHAGQLGLLRRMIGKPGAIP